MLVAGDTASAPPRSAGARRLGRTGWACRSSPDPNGGDAAGIVFDAVKQAIAERHRRTDRRDTAGRLQNKRELMDELLGISVLGRLNPAAPHDVVLVLDATTGQNALSQIDVFRDVAGATGP